ncbi:hypothetical protein OHB24_20690 [Kribbella sp. NBC_00482]|uniref:hypothetical protein n=1 Tax=Kribbella sp. NBC_00482 TaxID=2975968 RepID=UPI002E16D3B1
MVLWTADHPDRQMPCHPGRLAATLVPPLAVAGKDADTCKAVQTLNEVSLDAEQASNLAVIVGVGDRFEVGDGGKVIAVMTAMTESSLRNIDHGDTAGPFRDAVGWGGAGGSTDRRRGITEAGW